ncbi:Protein of unknown function DUF1262 [Macleaya cordata]|uniref:Uncharacterized protein n=1 Tax=Macleaya cordata TaxID=56857 RepID=A0A200Q7L4_MACCD|nr:Protein of unknown function DUF1262 [Macleaya cordata]
MYVTKPLSWYRKDPNNLSELTVQEGPNSGYLVITDEETEAEDTYCWGTCKDTNVRKLPLPQNKIVNVIYTSGNGEHRRTERKKVWFIPVLDQPLSANQYYVIRATGEHRGQACTCSREEDMSICCFCNIVNDVKPRVLDHRDIYQQVEIFKSRRGFTAKSIAPDGFPPHFLRRKGWKVYTSSSYKCQLGEALGLNVSLRMHLPELINFPISNKCRAVIVGKWYCPFVFVMEGSLKDQMKNSSFYEMTLEQTWEEIYTCENDNTKGNVVSVSVIMQKEAIKLFGEEASKDDTGGGVGGFVWFRHVDNYEQGLKLGLSLAIVEKMKWIQQKGGWVGGGEKNVGTVEKVEEFKGGNGWKRFGCYVLVERFALRRMDGTLLLTWDYRHIHQIQSKWE